ncbi:UNKNOWN [Stylonychia lemnae]|uniref:Uncharacterized protein n=1 Tax=Stylonychia lemnae TaxID=5949 RepID=A0A078AJV1_STYLE|nr:UNKNOWN [Stylonychia lemnae]|eukprot:CDW82166.1 UNKNOWN [Stylonychia lemnae]
MVRMQTQSVNNNSKNDIGTRAIIQCVGFILNSQKQHLVKHTFDTILNAFKFAVVYDPYKQFAFQDKLLDARQNVTQAELDALEDYLLGEETDEITFNQKISKIQEQILTIELSLSQGSSEDLIKQRVKQIKQMIGQRIKQFMAQSIMKKGLFGIKASSVNQSAASSIVVNTSKNNDSKLSGTFSPNVESIYQDDGVILAESLELKNIINKQNHKQSQSLRDRSLKHIYDYYRSLKILGNHKNISFDDMRREYEIMNLSQFMKFCIDFKIPMRKDRILECFKKQSPTQRDLDFVQFKLTVFLIFSQISSIEELEKKRKSSSPHLQVRKNNQKLNPIQNKDQIDRFNEQCARFLMLDQPEQLKYKLSKLQNTLGLGGQTIKSSIKSEFLNSPEQKISLNLSNISSSISGRQKYQYRQNKLMNEITKLKQGDDRRDGRFQNTEILRSKRSIGGDNSKNGSVHTLHSLSQIRYQELNTNDEDDFVPKNFGFEENPKREQLSITRIQSFKRLNSSTQVTDRHREKLSSGFTFYKQVNEEQQPRVFKLNDLLRPQQQQNIQYLNQSINGLQVKDMRIKKQKYPSTKRYNLESVYLNSNPKNEPVDPYRQTRTNLEKSYKSIDSGSPQRKPSAGIKNFRRISQLRLSANITTQLNAIQNKGLSKNLRASFDTYVGSTASLMNRMKTQNISNIKDSMINRKQLLLKIQPERQVSSTLGQYQIGHH